MVAVFIAQALSVIGAGSLIGIDVVQSSLLAGLLGVANVLENTCKKNILMMDNFSYEEVKPGILVF
jgi:hypothetical protein